jgi:gamma-glutamylaminecyclotransferase
MPNPEFVFVYGTLKRGYGNNERCLAESKFIGEAVSVGANFEMQRTGFPIIWEVPEGGAKVAGEIFQVTPADVARCDRLEGHPHMYKRERREFVTSDGKRDTAWVYLWQGEHYGEPVAPNDGVLTWTPRPAFVSDDDEVEEVGDE